jgi:hypothetical protein
MEFREPLNDADETPYKLGGRKPQLLNSKLQNPSSKQNSK